MAAPQNLIIQNSVMSLFIQMRCNGQPLASGTAFVATMNGAPALVTNRHNVTGRDQQTGQPLSPTGGIPNELVVAHNKAGQLGQWVQVVEPLYNGATPRWIEHKALGQNADFVALPLTQLGQVQLYPYDPANPGQLIRIAPSEVVSVIGFPFGIGVGGALAIWATGFVASELAADYDGKPAFLIDCRSRQGQSGSAVVAYRGNGSALLESGENVFFSGPVYRFLGIYSGRVNKESDLGIVWKASAIAELLNQGP